jgi:hypothetical protein
MSEMSDEMRRDERVAPLYQGIILVHPLGEIPPTRTSSILPEMTGTFACSTACASVCAHLRGDERVARVLGHQVRLLLLQDLRGGKESGVGTKGCEKTEGSAGGPWWGPWWGESAAGGRDGLGRWSEVRAQGVVRELRPSRPHPLFHKGLAPPPPPPNKQ